jgi:hypothetical protein
LAAQTAQAHVLAVVEPPAPAAQSLGGASGVDAPLSTSLFGDTLSSNPQRLPLVSPITRQKNGVLTTTPR